MAKQSAQATKQRAFDKKLAEYVRGLQLKELTANQIAERVFQRFGQLVHKVTTDEIVMRGIKGSEYIVKLKNPKTKQPSPAQLAARKKFAAMAKARSKAAKGKKRNKTVIKAKRVLVVNPKKRRVIPRRKIGTVWIETGGTLQGRNKYFVTVAAPSYPDGTRVADHYDKKQAEWEARMLRKKIKQHSHDTEWIWKARNSSKANTTYRAVTFPYGFYVVDNRNNRSELIKYNSHSEPIRSEAEAKRVAAEFIALVKKGELSLRNPSSKAKTALKTTGRALKSATRGILGAGAQILGAGASALNPQGFYKVSAININTGRREHFGYYGGKTQADAIRKAKADASYRRELGVGVRGKYRNWKAEYSKSDPGLRNPTKRLKVRNKYIDLVIRGTAKKTPQGWKVGKQTITQGKGTAKLSSGYYLDKATGAVYAKRERANPKRIKRRKLGSVWVETRGTTQGRNKYVVLLSTEINRDLGESMAESFDKKQAEWEARMLRKRLKQNPKRRRNADHKDSDHPIEVTKHWRQGPPGYLTPWQRAHHAGQKQLFETGIKPAKKRNSSKKKATIAKRIKKGDIVKDNYGKLHEVFSVSGNVVTTIKGQHFHKTKVWPVKKINPSAESIRKSFAGRVGKGVDLYFPDGTPQGLAKLGKLVLIKTQAGEIKPQKGTVWLCSDTRGKLHLGSTTNAKLWSGSAQNFGEVLRLEYDESKPHLGYPKKVTWFHRMGEETGERPTLYADGKGGLKFRGGAYKITSRGIVN